MSQVQDKPCKSDETLSILKGSKVFRHLPLDVLRQIATTARTEHFTKLTIVVHRQSVPQHIRYIVAGGLGTSLTTSDGKAAMLPPDRQGRWAPWAGCFIRTPLPHDLWCMPSSTFLAFPASTVRAALSNNPQALLEAIDMIGTAMRAVIAWALAVHLTSDEKRLAQLFCYISEKRLDAISGGIETMLTQEQIAQLGFGSRQHVSKILRTLDSKGLVEVHYGHITIPSLVELHKFAFELA